MAIDATVAGENANSYQTLVEADAYFAVKVNNATWDAFADADKTIALQHATAVIDSLGFKGIKTDPDQALKFPRYDDGRTYSLDSSSDLIIPTQIAAACNECALWLLVTQGVESLGQTMQRSVDSFSMGGVSYSGLKNNASARIGPIAASKLNIYLKRTGSTNKKTGLYSGYIPGPDKI